MKLLNKFRLVVISSLLLGLCTVVQAEQKATKVDKNVSSAEATEPAATPAAPAKEQPAPPPRATEKKSWNISPYVFYSLADIYESDYTGSQGSVSLTGNAKARFDDAPGVGLDYMFSPEDSWGVSVGASFDFVRKVKSITINSGNDSVTETPTSNPAKLTFLLVNLNALYRWKKFYIPFGINYSLPTYDRGTGAQGKLEVNGDLGAQLGVGFRFVDEFAAEIISRVVGFSFDGRVDDVSYKFENGYLAGLQVQIRYLF